MPPKKSNKSESKKELLKKSKIEQSLTNNSEAEILIQKMKENEKNKEKHTHSEQLCQKNPITGSKKANGVCCVCIAEICDDCGFRCLLYSCRGTFCYLHSPKEHNEKNPYCAHDIFKMRADDFYPTTINEKKED